MKILISLQANSSCEGVIMGRVLIACEESQVVCLAFRALGHEAYSCDIMPAQGGQLSLLDESKPQYHLKGDVLPVLDWGWDMIIAFPPCTNLCVSGARWFDHKIKSGEQQQSIDFFMRIANAPCPKIAIENPIGIMSTVYRKPDQIIQPWQFGHNETKATCLWLKGLPKLKPTKIVEGRSTKVWLMPPSKDRARLRSKTYQGIGDAMASQWGSTLDSTSKPFTSETLNKMVSYFTWNEA